jgi:hypothetical protein
MSMKKLLTTISGLILPHLQKEEKDKEREEREERERINIRRRKLGYEDLNENYIKENAERAQVDPLALAESSSAAASSTTVSRDSEEGLMGARERGFEILSEETIISGLEEISRYEDVEESYLQPVVNEYSCSLKEEIRQHTQTFKFTVSGIQFEIVKIVYPDNHGPLIIRVNNEIVVKVYWHITTLTTDIWHPNETIITRRNDDLVKLKKDWVEALKLFFQAQFGGFQAKNLNLEKEKGDRFLQKLLDRSDDIDLGDYE